LARAPAKGAGAGGAGFAGRVFVALGGPNAGAAAAVAKKIARSPAPNATTLTPSNGARSSAPFNRQATLSGEWRNRR
jgi:hypothetical protein